MRELTFTAAAREALAEEMARDPSIFVVGEGIGPRRQLRHHHRSVRSLRPDAPARHPDCRTRVHRHVHRRSGYYWFAAVVDFMFVDFILDGMGELINQVAKIQYMSSGRLKMPMVLRGSIGISVRFRHPSFRQLLPAVRQHSRLPRRRPQQPLRRQRTVQNRAARQ